MARTNETSTGYTFDGQDYTNQTRTDAGGNSYSVAIPVAGINTGATPIVPTQPTYGADTTTTPRVVSYLQSASDTAQANLDAQNKEGLSAGSNLASLQELLGGKAADTSAALKATGATDIAAQLRNLNAQSIALGQDTLAKTLAEQNKATGQNITGTAVQRNIGDATRENTINIAKIGMQAAIAKADYDTAKDMADTMVNAKYEKILAQIEASKTNLALLDKYVLTPSQEKAKTARSEFLSQQTIETNRKMEEEKSIQKMMVDAAPNAPSNILANAKRIADAGGTQLAVAQALGVYGGDYLVREKMKAEIRRIDAEAVKTRKEASSTGTPLAGETSNAQNWVSQFNSGLLSIEEIYTKIGSSKEASGLKNEVARIIAGQKGKRVYGLDDASVLAINAQIKNVDNLLKGGVGSIVGLVQGGLGVLPDRLNIYKQDTLAIAKNLVSNQTLQALADAKSKGITFGALSEGELSLVSDSASAIASKLKTKKDKSGNVSVIGFTGTEAQFKKDLQIIKDGLAKSIINRTQGSEDSTADDILRANIKVRAEIGSGVNLFDN